MIYNNSLTKKKYKFIKKVLLKPNHIIFNYNNKEYVLSTMLQPMLKEILIFETNDIDNTYGYSKIDELLNNYCILNRPLIECLQDIHYFSYI